MAPHALEPRVDALECHVGEIESGFGETIYQTHRELIRTQITLARLASKSGVELATDDEIDAAIEERS